MKAIQITDFGGPEVLELTELPDPDPGPGEALIEVTRAGVNFGDTHQRENDYLAKAELPLIPGGEVVGTTADGRRVAAMLPMTGGYAEKVAVHEAALVPVPDDVTDDQAAAVLVQGLTAWALLGVSGRVVEGETVVVSAAAGGTGTLTVQLAKRLGARVIALASSEEKRELALRLGADAAVDSRSDDLTAAILAANDGRPVDVTTEMAGGAAFEGCFGALAPFGRLVTFGIASREPNEVQTGKLMRTSRGVIGFWLVHLFQRPDLVQQGIQTLFGALAAGDLEVVVGEVYPLSETKRAHEDIVARRTTGKLLLDPSA